MNKHNCVFSSLISLSISAVIKQFVRVYDTINVFTKYCEYPWAKNDLQSFGCNGYANFVYDVVTLVLSYNDL